MGHKNDKYITRSWDQGDMPRQNFGASVTRRHVRGRRGKVDKKKESSNFVGELDLDDGQSRKDRSGQ